MFTVTVTERGEASEDLVFDQAEVTIGRVRGNDIVLRKGSVSKRHAKIVLKDNKFVVIDLKSTNGTIVNGRKITAPQVIRENDKLVIGDYVLEVSHKAGASKEPPRTGGSAPAKSSTDAVGPPPAPPGPPTPRAAASAPNPTDPRAIPYSGESEGGAKPPLPQPTSSAHNTLAMRVPLELLREPTGTVTQGAPLRLPPSVFTDPFADAHARALASVLDSLPHDELPTAYPPAGADRTRVERAVRLALPTSTEAGQPEDLTNILVHELVGLGPIEFYLDDPEISEIHVNGYDRVFVRKSGALEAAPLAWASPATLTAAARRMMQAADVHDPFGGSVRLPDGTRIEVVLPPASAGGPVLTITKPLRTSPSIDQMVESESLSQSIATALKVAIENRGGVLITSTSSDDATRFLNALLQDVGDARRVVAVETVPSLKLPQATAVRLETVPNSTPSSLQRAVTLQPEVLAVDPFGGEMVVEWLLDVAAAPCAFVATFGGRHPDDALSRLVVMGLQGEASDASAVRSQIATSLDLMVHLGRYQDRVIVSQVSDVGLDTGELTQQIVFHSRMGPGGLEFNSTGHVPRLFSALMESGVEFDTSIFNT